MCSFYHRITNFFRHNNFKFRVPFDLPPNQNPAVAYVESSQIFRMRSFYEPMQSVAVQKKWLLFCLLLLEIPFFRVTREAAAPDAACALDIWALFHSLLGRRRGGVVG